MLEVLAYAEDEAASLGHTGTVTVTVRPDGTVTIDDDGRGTDTRIDREWSGTRITFRTDVDGPGDLTDVDLRAFANLVVNRD